MKNLYIGDSLEVMRKVDFVPNLIITDPPYNINWDYKYG